MKRRLTCKIFLPLKILQPYEFRVLDGVDEKKEDCGYSEREARTQLGLLIPFQFRPATFPERIFWEKAR